MFTCVHTCVYVGDLDFLEYIYVCGGVCVRTIWRCVMLVCGAVVGYNVSLAPLLSSLLCEVHNVKLSSV